MKNWFVNRLILIVLIATTIGFGFGLTVAIFLKVSVSLAAVILATSSVTTAVLTTLALPLLFEPIYRLTAALREGEEPSSLLLQELGMLGEAISSAWKSWKETVAELKEERTLLQAILRRMDEAIIVAQENGAVILANPAAQKLFQLPDDYAKKRLTELDLPFGLMELAQNSIRRKLPQMGEVHIVHPKEKFLDAYATPLLINGKLEGILLVARDLTELKRLERIRRDFVANVSHELRTPIATLRSLAEALLMGGKDDPEVRDSFLQAIAEESERMSRLIDNLLELAQIEAGELEWHLQEVSVSDIARQVVERFKPAAGQKGLTMSVDLTDGLNLFTDPDALTQILSNLVDNAVKYTERGGIAVKTEQVETVDGKWVVISVSDTGIGIPPEHLPRIFERFYRVDKARSRQSGGVGLGLSIAKHLAESLGGKITVQSQVGKGSTFSVWLPCS
ncbi:MAG: ATP-binding protein [Armatimonadota bacterium]|nr:ATP-binding protein [Armatimonadota bacterium]MDW8143388.1 ATP-binding protein [Armatimonadota bacterium]